MRLFSALCALVLVSSCGASPAAARTGPVPVAIMHGILGKASKMDAVIEWTKAILPGEKKKRVRFPFPSLSFFTAVDLVLQC
jgi:hypothetical protein